MKSAPREVQSDLSRFHGRRIREFWHTLFTGDVEGGMSPLELVTFVEMLPDESAVKRRFGSGWTDQELMIARLANDFRSAHTEEGKQPENPLIPPNQREDDVDEEADANAPTTDQIERMLDGDVSVYDELEPAAA